MIFVDVSYLNVVGKISTAIEVIMFVETLAAAWKIDDRIKMLGVPVEKYNPQLKLPAIRANATKIIVLKREFFKFSSDLPI